MKSDRLLSILLLLQTRGRVPAHELAERLEVSVRTIYRDVEALSASGVPVYAERGRHGGIELLAGFRTDVTGLTADESRSLFILAAQGAHAALGLDAALGSALRKVMTALPAPFRPAAEVTSRRILVDATRWRGGPRRAVDLDVLQDAVFSDRRCGCATATAGTPNRAPAPSTRTASSPRPVSGTWSPTGAELRGCSAPTGSVRPPCCRTRCGAVRASNSPTPGRRCAVRSRSGRGVSTSRFGYGAPVSTCSYAFTWPPSRSCPRTTALSEWVTARLSLGSVRETRTLLAFGDALEVLAPAEAREELAATAAAIAAVYEGG